MTRPPPAPGAAGTRHGGRRLLAALMLTSLAAVSCAPGRAADTFQAGAARLDITPGDLSGLDPMGGSFERVHDPIFVRVLVLDDGRSRVAILSLDLIEVGDMRAIRQRLETETGIARDHIMITATHDHSAPRIGRVSPGALAHDGGVESDAYTDFVVERMVEALHVAIAAMRSARLGIGTGTADINVNRDAYVPGRGWTLGFNPSGPSDKAVRVLKFEDASGAPIAVLMNYAVHSTVTLGSKALGGDIAGAAQAHVEAGLGGDTVALWTLGAVGDQGPRVSPRRPAPAASPTVAAQAFATAFAAAAAQGLMVGAEVLRVTAAISADAATPTALFAAERVVACPVKRGEQVLATMVQDEVDHVDLRLHLIMIGRIALAGVSGEVVTPIATRLRAESPLKETVLISLANDRIGYIPDDAAYDQPTFPVKGSPIARGCAEDAIIDGFKAMIAAHGAG